jgi:hypothetical protein
MSRDENTAFANLRACADDAPEGTYEQAKQIRQAIAVAMDKLQARLKDAGLVVDQCDAAHACEAAMYAYAKRSNPEATVFPTAEGFGSWMGTESRARVLADTIRDRDALKRLRTKNKHGATCEETCGPMAAKGFHSLMCVTVEKLHEAI